MNDANTAALRARGSRLTDGADRAVARIPRPARAH